MVREIPAARRRGGGDGGVFPWVGLRQATREGERGGTGGGAARAWSPPPMPHPLPFISVKGNGQGGAPWNLPKPSRNFRYPAGKFPNLSDASVNHFPYMNLILRTLPGLLVVSRILSETPNQYSFIPSIISLQTLAISER